MSVSVTNTDAGLSGKTVDLLESDQTITGLKSFSRSTNPPFAVNSGAAKVTNLDADKLDGQEGAYYQNADNISAGTLAIARGGTGAATANANVVFAGPTSGSAAAPSFRALVEADLPTTVVKPLSHDTSVATVASTATETSVFSYTVPGGTLSTNRALRITLIGDYLNNNSADTFTLKLKYGATTVLTAAWSTSSNANRGAVLAQFLLSAAGATGAQVAGGWASLAEGPDNNAAGTMTVTSTTQKLLLGSQHTISEDSTADKTLEITADHANSSANLSFRCHAVHVELV